MKDVVKIQLNSEKAIKALIENDPELEIEIKNKIACAIAKGYEMANQAVLDFSVEGATKKVMDATMQRLTYTKKEQGSWHHNTYISPEVQFLVDRYISDAIKEAVRSAVYEAEDKLEVQIKERIDLMAASIENRIMDEAFHNSVESEVVKRLSRIQKELDREAREEKLNV